MDTPLAQSSRMAATRPSLAFSDPDSALRWAKTLPFLNVAQVYEQVIGQLRALSAAEFTPRERATIAELMREQAMHLHTELARRYAGKPQPAIDRELEAAEEAVALWSALWEQYSACLKPLLEGDPELAGVKAKILQRGLYVGKQLLVVHGLARRVPPGTFWQELHAYYRLAEMLDCAVTAVSDELNPQAVGTSCYSMYVHALLLALADPFSLSVRQIELADRWLSQWARKVFPYDQERETEGPVLVVDLDSAEGARLVAGVPPQPPASMRFGYPGKLAMSVRGRIRRLATGANPGELQLGHDVSVEQCSALLAHLDAHWYQLPAPPADADVGRVQLCGGGVPAAYFRVGGRTFDRQDPLGRKTFQGTQHLTTLGALTDYDRNKEEAQRNWPWEPWHGRHDWHGGELIREGGPRHRWFLDALVVVNEGQRTRLGHVTRVALGPNEQLALSVALWPGAPRTMAVRPLAHAFSEDPPIPVLLLGETADEKPTAIVPSRTFSPGRILRSMDAGPERKLKLTRLVQRGADFERVAFDELPLS
ncbi:MAG: hypothetical protein JSR18_16490 [Proteobacteria bacterium]|nr:hypothetical protein [Pseudomonadota bacterium]